MRVVLSLLVIGLAAVSAEPQPQVDPEGVAHADEDCSKLFCKDTDQGHVHFQPRKNPETGKCECGGYYTEGPCAGLKCPTAGFLTKELPANETHPASCVCVLPCLGRQCAPPALAITDYTRRIEGWCKCYTPKDKELLAPLPKNDTHWWLPKFHVDGDECLERTCDTKWGIVNYKPEKVTRNGKETCECTHVYKQGSPCHGLTCPDYLLLVQNKTTNKCECINPCSNVMCEAPAAPMIDYLRETEGLCKCVVVTDKAHAYHEEL